jgi:hypothetical protein
MAYNPNYVSYIGGLEDDTGDACSVYGLYIGKCGQPYTNNFQVAINGKYIGNFWGSLSQSAYMQNGWEQKPKDADGGWFSCPIVLSHGAPLWCIYSPYIEQTNLYYNPTAYPIVSVHECGGDDAVLWVFSNNEESFRSWPNSSSNPVGSKWPSSAEYPTIKYIGNVFLNGDTSPNNGWLSSSATNYLDLYPYRDWYDKGLYCEYSYIIDYDEETEEPLYGSTIIPNAPEPLIGIPGCIGIIKWNRDSDGYLVCDKFYPVKSLSTNNLTNKLTAGITLNQDSYYWWTEANIPVAHNPLPDWVQANYYW